MFDALTYQEMLKEIKKNSEKYGITDDVVAILITRPDGQGLWSMQVNAIRRQHLLVKKILTEIYEIYFQKIILFSFHLIR